MSPAAALQAAQAIQPATPLRTLDVELLRANLPERISNNKRFCVWLYEWNGKRFEKIPYHPRGGRLSTNKPEKWVSFDDALAGYNSGKWDGVGYLLAKEDGIVGIDLDKCRNRSTGKIDPWALDVIRRLDSYTEVSPSGTGVRIFVLGTKPGNRSRKPPDREMYDGSAGRFLSVTGARLEDTPHDLQERPLALHQLYADWWPPQQPIEYAPAGDRLALDDAELLRRALDCETTGTDFRALYIAGNVSLYGGDNSRADFNLCRKLAWWCGHDAQQVDRLFRGSALYRADRWDAPNAGGTYGSRTIANAINSLHGDHYTGRTSRSTTPPAPGSTSLQLEVKPAGGDCEQTIAELRRQLDAANARIEALEDENYELRAELDWINDLHLAPNTDMQSNHREALHLLKQYIELEGLKPGDRRVTREQDVAERLGIPAAKARRMLATGAALGVLDLDKQSRPQIGHNGTRIANAETGVLYTKRTRVLALRAMPRDLEVTMLVGPRPKKEDGTEGDRWGGARRGCAVAGCKHELKKVSYWTCPEHGGMYDKDGAPLQLEAAPAIVDGASSLQVEVCKETDLHRFGNTYSFQLEVNPSEAAPAPEAAKPVQIQSPVAPASPVLQSDAGRAVEPAPAPQTTQNHAEPSAYAAGDVDDYEPSGADLDWYQAQPLDYVDGYTAGDEPPIGEPGPNRCPTCHTDRNDPAAVWLCQCEAQQSDIAAYRAARGAPSTVAGMGGAGHA